MFEMLESRQLLAAPSVFLGAECLPSAPPPPVFGQPSAPLPSSPAPSNPSAPSDPTSPGHHPTPNKPKPKPKPTPKPKPNPKPVPAAQLVGEWAGRHAEVDGDVEGGMTLRVGKVKGDLFGEVTFDGPLAFEHTSRLNYSAKTGRFTLYVVSPKLVIRVDGAVTGRGNNARLEGDVQYYTKQGAYKATFALTPGHSREDD
jgi:hypothetical protein